MRHICSEKSEEAVKSAPSKPIADTCRHIYFGEKSKELLRSAPSKPIADLGCCVCNSFVCESVHHWMSTPLAEPKPRNLCWGKGMIRYNIVCSSISSHTAVNPSLSSSHREANKNVLPPRGAGGGRRPRPCGRSQPIIVVQVFLLDFGAEDRSLIILLIYREGRKVYFRPHCLLFKFKFKCWQPIIAGICFFMSTVESLSFVGEAAVEVSVCICRWGYVLRHCLIFKFKSHCSVVQVTLDLELGAEDRSLIILQGRTEGPFRP